MKKMLLCAGILCSAGVLSAADFRIDVGGERDKVELEVKECSEKIRSSPAGWLNERKNQRLVFIGAASDQWEKKSISFIPKSNGNVEVCLMGTINKPGAPHLGYDDIKVNGKLLKNGSFEEGSGDRIANWSGWGKAARVAGGAADGNQYVLANHVDALVQSIPVKAGEKVTITFQVKNGK